MIIVRLNDERGFIGILRSKFEQNGYLYNYYNGNHQNYRFKNKNKCKSLIYIIFQKNLLGSQIPLQAFSHLNFFTRNFTDMILDRIEDPSEFANRLNIGINNLVYIDLEMKRFGFLAHTSTGCSPQIFHYATNVINKTEHGCDLVSLKLVSNQIYKLQIVRNLKKKTYTIPKNQTVSTSPDNSIINLMFLDYLSTPNLKDCFYPHRERNMSVIALSNFYDFDKF